jgi:hypothetical protein
LVQALQYVADNFKEIADVVAAFATVLITAFTGRAIAGVVVGLGQAVVALGSFLTALRTGTSVVAAFSASLGPIGLLAGAAAGAVYLLYNNMSSGDHAAKSFSESVDGNKVVLENAASASRQYGNHVHDGGLSTGRHAPDPEPDGNHRQCEQQYVTHADSSVDWHEPDERALSRALSARWCSCHSSDDNAY